MSMEQDVFLLAEQALQAVVAQITDAQWDLRTPTIRHIGDTVPTLRELINRHTYDDLWVPETLAGKTIDEVGIKYDGNLLGDDPQASFARGVEIASLAVKGLNEDDLAKMAHLSYGDFPIREYLKHITTYRGFRVYSIAKFLGVDSTMPADLVQGLWDEVASDAEQWRAIGVFGPAIEVSEDADLQTKLLGLTGFLLP